MSSRGGEALRATAIGLLPPGTRVGRYEIVDLLGAGGMGVVYTAHDPELDRSVALNLLYPTLSLDGDDELAERLRHESKAMARLRHPNVATIHDVGSYRDQLFLVMESSTARRCARGSAAARRGRRSSPRSHRRAMAWLPLTRPASCIATSSPTTCCSTRRAAR